MNDRFKTALELNAIYLIISRFSACFSIKIEDSTKKEYKLISFTISGDVETLEQLDFCLFAIGASEVSTYNELGDLIAVFTFNGFLPDLKFSDTDNMALVM